MPVAASNPNNVEYVALRNGDGIAAAAVSGIAMSIPHFQQELGEPATQRWEPRTPEHPETTASPR